MKKTVALAFVFLSNLLFLSGCIAKTYSCTIYENTNYDRIIDASSAKLNEVRINQINYKILYDETRLNEFTNQRIDRYSVDGAGTYGSITLEANSQKLISFNNITPFPAIEDFELMSDEQLRQAVESLMKDLVDFSIYNTFKVCRYEGDIRFATLYWQVKRELLCDIRVVIDINRDGIINGFTRIDNCPDDLSKSFLDDSEKNNLIDQAVMKHLKIDNLENYTTTVEEVLCAYQGKPSLLCSVDILDPEGFAMRIICIIN